jgi:hypothetical protein
MALQKSPSMCELESFKYNRILGMPHHYSKKNCTEFISAGGVKPFGSGIMRGKLSG